MLVVRPHSRARDPYRVSGTGPGGAGRAGGQRSDRAGRAARSGLGDGRRAVGHSLGRGCRAPGGRWPTRRAAVVRIIEVPMEDGKGYQAEIYAEGEVRISGQGGPPRPQVRTVLRTRKQVQLRAYRENGLTQWKEPPRDLLILRRSGFVLPEPAAARSKPATSGRNRRLHHRSWRLFRRRRSWHLPHLDLLLGSRRLLSRNQSPPPRPKRPPPCSRRICRL